MNVSQIPPPSSPWPGRVARDLEMLLFSVVVGFSLSFGGWHLAGQISPSPDAEIGAEQRLISGVERPRPDLTLDGLAADDLTADLAASIDLDFTPLDDS